MRKCELFASLITCWETSAGSATAANTPAPTIVDASVTIARFDLKRRTFCLLPKGTARCDPTAPPTVEAGDHRAYGACRWVCGGPTPRSPDREPPLTAGAECRTNARM